MIWDSAGFTLCSVLAILAVLQGVIGCLLLGIGDRPTCCLCSRLKCLAFRMVDCDLRSGSQRKDQREGGALACGGLEPNLPTMPFDELPADKQAQSRPWDAMVMHVARPREAMEEPPMLVGGDANPLVANAYLCPPRTRIGPHCHRDRPALRAVLDGIPHQISQHLPEAQAIRREHHRTGGASRVSVCLSVVNCN